jgi:selenocysteine lyase/cysteine desulfurase
VLNRRELLAGAAAAGTLAACGSSSKQTPDGPVVRDFAQFYLAAHGARVRRAVERHREGLDSGTFAYMADHEHELDEAVRSAAAGFLGVAGEEVAFTGSTTMGLGLLYTGLVRPGDEVLTTEHDFFATYEALDFAGARVKRVALYDDPADATPDAIVARLMRGLTPRTRVVAITWVHSSTGVKLPVRAIADALRGRALLCVDGVHGLAAELSELPELGCDAFVSGCHKWLGGPRGTGIMWAPDAVWPKIRPVIPSFTGDRTPGGFHAFEHRWALAEAFRHPPTVDPDLATRLKTGLAGVDGVRMVTPLSEDVSAGLVCIEKDSRTPEEAVEALRHEHRVIASITPYRERYVRFGTLGVTAEDVDAAVRAVAAI